MPGRSLLVFMMVLSFVTACLPRGTAATAPDVSPADAGGDTGALNLPAMVLTPADLDVAGFPGYGKLGDGTFVPLDVLVAYTAAARGLPEDEVRATYQDAGWRRFYGTHLGLPSVPGDSASRATQIAYSFVTEYADAAGAAAAFASLTEHGDSVQARIAAVAGTAVVGDDSRIESTVGADSASGPDTELAILFRRGNLIGSVGFEACCTAASLVGTAAYAPPDAWPIPGAASIAGAAVDLGDETRVVGIGEGFNSDLPAAYELYVRVGTTVVTVFLGSTLRPDLAIVAELAAAQVACLAAAVCAPVPLPAALRAG